MKIQRLYIKTPIACLLALSVSGSAFANSIERLNSEIWHPHPELLESTVETGRLPLSHEDDGSLVLENDGKMTMDVDLLAKESGMSRSQAVDTIQAQNEFAHYANKLMAKFPNRISRMWKEPAPGTKSHIQFMGKVPTQVLEEISANKTPANVSITGGGSMSFQDNVTRAQVAARGLRKAGYPRSLSFYDPATNSIQVEIKVPKKSARPDRSRILSAVQSELKGTDLSDQIRSITGKELRIKTLEGEGEIMEFDHVRGGNWIQDDGVRECTSGWSVSGPNGDGFITAAHCSGINGFEEAGGLVFSTTWRDQEFGSGDVEYHTSSHIALDDFYATASSIRDVSGIRSWWTMFGASVCEYGRSSNTRTCNHTVDGLLVTVNYSIGTVNNLIRVTGDNSIGGDSGGGWSFNYTAWGVHSGSNGSQSFFTPADLAESALGVTIKR